MNLNAHPTVDQLRDLLRGNDDRAGHHVLRVRQVGEVLLACLTSERSAQNNKFGSIVATTGLSPVEHMFLH